MESLGGADGVDPALGGGGKVERAAIPGLAVATVGVDDHGPVCDAASC